MYISPSPPPPPPKQNQKKTNNNKNQQHNNKIKHAPWTYILLRGSFFMHIYKLLFIHSVIQTNLDKKMYKIKSV